jgi:transcriptional regulator with XRE-family HTH domain
MSIHSRIKNRRLKMGLSSHKALADLCGVSWQTVQLWEKEGGTAPKRDRIEAVAKALGVTSEWLLTGQEIAGAQPSDEKATVTEQQMQLHYITAEEAQLLELFRLSNPRGQEAILLTARGTKKKTSSVIHYYES